MPVRSRVLALLVAALAVGCTTTANEPSGDTGSPEPSSSASVELDDGDGDDDADQPEHAKGPLAGKVIVIDPGHQLGNGAHPAEIARPVPAGGFEKPCNTTGAATDAGVPEATVVWRISRIVARELRARGATVELTRHSNAADEWGPCVDVRGRAGNPRPGHPGADAKVSIHADGNYGGGPGFHVIVPADRAPWTDDIAVPSARLGELLRDALVRRGIRPAAYVGSNGIDVRSDLATLNLADIPTVMLESGNLRDPEDAERLTSPRGQRRYARAVVAALSQLLGRSR